MEYKLGWFSLFFGIFWLLATLVFIGQLPMSVGLVRIVSVVFYICGVVFFFMGIFYLGVKYGLYSIKSRSKVPEDDDSNRIKVDDTKK